VIGIGRFQKVRHGRFGLAVGMRVIEADDVESATPRLAASGDVFGRIQLVPMWIVGDVADSCGVDDLLSAAEQQAAAFSWKRVLCMRRDGIEDDPRNPDGYSASTTIAIPIPPPMQSEARP
jgi:hypothetical protein